MPAIVDNSPKTVDNLPFPVDNFWKKVDPTRKNLGITGQIFVHKSSRFREKKCIPHRKAMDFCGKHLLRANFPVDNLPSPVDNPPKPVDNRAQAVDNSLLKRQIIE